MRKKIKYSFILCFSFIFVSFMAHSEESCDQILNLNGGGYWPLNEGSGSIAYDLSGNQNDGQLVNDPEWVEGKLGTGLLFDSELGNHVQISNSESLKIGIGDLSLAAWVKSSEDDFAILSNRQAPFEIGILFVFNGSEKTLLQFADDENGWFNYQTDSGPDINDDEWHHVVITVDRDDIEGGIMYVDGEAVYHFNPTNRQGSLDNDADFFIGKVEVEDFFNMDGILDDIILARRVLTQDEVKALYEGQLQTEYIQCLETLEEDDSSESTTGEPETDVETSSGLPNEQEPVGTISGAGCQINASSTLPIFWSFIVLSICLMGRFRGKK